MGKTWLTHVWGRGGGGGHLQGVLVSGGIPPAFLPHLGVVLQDDGAGGAGPAQRLEDATVGGILGLLVKLEVDHGLCKLAEGGRGVARQDLRAGGHLLFADQEPLVVPLQVFPWLACGDVVVGLRLGYPPPPLFFSPGALGPINLPFHTNRHIFEHFKTSCIMTAHKSIGCLPGSIPSGIMSTSSQSFNLREGGGGTRVKRHLVALPRESAAQQENEGVGERL